MQEEIKESSPCGHDGCAWNTTHPSGFCRTHRVEGVVKLLKPSEFCKEIERIRAERAAKK